MEGDKQRIMTTLLILLLGFLPTLAMENKTSSEQPSASRVKKALGIFSVVSFPNTDCVGSGGLNGTCYTSEECTSKGGSTAGTCASSFGVCCIFSLSCGSTSTENSTYHAITAYSTNTDASPCTYTICPCNTDVCKIRIDMETFVTAGPFTVVDAINALITAGPKVGDCVTDSFSVTNPGGVSPPVICGTNTGQHMYVDASPECNILSFNIDQTSSISRSWNLKVTQMDCTSAYAAHDCLQYLTGASGTFSSFNFDTTATTVTVGSNLHHLNDQMYDVCFRREEGYCALCFSPGVTGTAFGVSASKDAAAAQAANEITCTGVPGAVYADFISVNGLLDPTAIQSSTENTAATTAQKVCGQIFAVIEAATAAVTACTYRVPFKWGVHFDDVEVVIADGSIAGGALDTAENNGGTIGFYMNYFQKSC